MNRTSFTLIFLLGTLAALVVALGVAHDLNRAGMAQSDRNGSANASLVSGCEMPPLSFVSQSRPFVPSVEGEEHSASSAATEAVIELIVLTNAPYPKQPTYVAPEPKPTAAPSAAAAKSKRCVVDRRRLAKTLAQAAESQRDAVAQVERLIDENDGLNDLSAAGNVPYGRLLVGPSCEVVILKLDGGLAALRPSGVVSLSTDGRQALSAFDGGAAFGAKTTLVSSRESLRLWRTDAAAFAEGVSDLADDVVTALGQGVDRIALIARSAEWANRGLDRGLAALSEHVGLAALLPSSQAPALRSAGRRGGAAR